MNNLKLVLLILVILPIKSVVESEKICAIKSQLATEYSHNNLVAAICNEDMQRIKTLLDEGNVEKEAGIEALAAAIIYGNSEILNFLLLNTGVDIGAVYNDLLYLAHACEDTNIIELLKSFMHTAKINKFKQNALVDCGHDSLIGAVCSDSIDRVKALLEMGADVNEIEKNGWTPLGVAVGCENKEIVSLLLHNGADIHAGSVLLKAISNQVSDINLIKLLLEHGADVDEVSADTDFTFDTNVTPLMYAVASPTCDSHTVKLIELLLKHGADINARCDSRVMRIESGEGRLDCWHDLTGGESNKEGRSVLMHAYNLDIIKLLLDKGADVNPTPCYWGKTPLVQALRSSRAIALLLDYGADVNVRYDGTTPLIDAVKKGVDSTVVGLLLNNGAHVSVQDNDGYSPIMYAVARNNVEIVQLLLAKDPDLTVKSRVRIIYDHNGLTIYRSEYASEKTAFDIAKEQNNSVIISLFEQKFATQKQ